MENLQIGDLVVLTAGSMRMAVEAVDGEAVACVWCHEGKIGRDSFNAKLLKKWEHREDDHRPARAEGGARPYRGDREGGGKPYAPRGDGPQRRAARRQAARQARLGRQAAREEVLPQGLTRAHAPPRAMRGDASLAIRRKESPKVLSRSTSDPAPWREQPARTKGRDARMTVRFAVLVAAALTAGGAMAQDYPTGPITMVVPFSAGGPTDTVARIIGEQMGAALGQQIVVQNVAGAGGTLGAHRGRERGAGRLHRAAASHRHVDGPVALRGAAPTIR